jgi:phosphonate metabolism protein PhnN/1,5-bisphosphokinase (PRPP-forming)
MPARGTLFLIVGPSGAGKDTLIALARETLGPGYVFPRRAITRPAGAGGEDHVAEDQASFEACERAGNFALSWRAHGLAYGIPSSIATDLKLGKHVVINVSRAVIGEARAKFQPVRVILVTASKEVLRARLKARGREDSASIEERLGRGQDIAADAVIVNETTPQSGAAALVAALKG